MTAMLPASVLVALPGMSKARTPKLDALVVCRSIGTDEERTRWDLQDVVRGRLESDAFPLRLPGLGVYLALTGMHGSYELAVEIVELQSGEVVVSTRTESPKRVSDPLAVVTECIPLPAVTFEDRGRYACRLLANGDLVHETAFEVDWPKPQYVQGQMSPQSFARVLERLKAKEPGLDDEGIARACGVEPAFLAKMTRSFEGLDPEHGRELIARLCDRYRLRPEEFFEGHG